MTDEIERAEKAWRELCDTEGKETMEMAEPRDLFQMGFDAGSRAIAASEREKVGANTVDQISAQMRESARGCEQKQSGYGTGYWRLHDQDFTRLAEVALQAASEREKALLGLLSKWREAFDGGYSPDGDLLDDTDRAVLNTGESHDR